MTRLRRFLHLERPRSEPADAADPSPATAERFEGVERPTARNAPAAPRSSGADLERFGPEPEPGIELARAPAGARAFTRCMRCGTDHHVAAAECSSCGEGLDTDAQREFNERLWARRQEEAAREAAAEAERRVLAERAEAELAAARRGMAEELAREVGRRERRRLGREGLGGFGGLGGPDPGGPPLGWRLLAALPDWRWRSGAIVAAVATVGGLLAVGRAGHPGATVVALALVVVLVVPRWRFDRW